MKHDIIEAFRLLDPKAQRKLVLATGTACNEILTEFGVNSPEYQNVVGIHDVMREIYESR